MITTVLCSSILNSNIEREIKESLRAIAYSLDSTYDKLYEGDYHRDKTYTLYKGDEVMTANTELLDSIKEKSGIEMSLYYEDKIEVTTLMRKAGGSATGIQMEADLYKRLQNGEEIFYSRYDLQGIIYYGYFIPLRNSDSIAGAIFAGRQADEVESAIQKQVMVLVGSLVSIMLIFMIFLLIFSRYLSKSMKRTKSFLKKIADGELNYNVKGKAVKNKDEIGDIYRIAIYLQKELNDIVGNMKTSSGLLITSSDNLQNISGDIHEKVNKTYTSAEDIVSNAEIQAEQTEQTVSQISEIGKQIEYVSEAMESLQQNMGRMSEAESLSHKVINEFSLSNEEVVNAISEIANQIEVTNDAVQQIQNTIAIIQNIADETDLLSVNASIEAAHAGESGSGFAVIAEQISKLAGQSAINAVNVEKTLVRLKQESETMVEIMDKVKQMMDVQSCRLDETISNFEVVEQGVIESTASVDSVKKYMDKLEESKDVILQNVHEQTSIAERFVETTENVTLMVKSVDQRMEELEKTAEELRSISNEMCVSWENFNC